MKLLKTGAGLTVGSILLLAVLGAAEKAKDLSEMMTAYDRWDNPNVCRGCHEEKFETWETSQMSRALPAISSRRSISTWC